MVFFRGVRLKGKKMVTKASKFIIPALLLTALFSGMVSGASVFWNSPDGIWCESSNWWDGSSTRLPTFSDNVYLDGDSICNITADCNDCRTSTLYGPAYGDNFDFTLNIFPEGVLNVSNSWSIASNGANSVGIVNMSGGTVNVMQAGMGSMSIAYFGQGLFYQIGGQVDVAGWVEAAYSGTGKATIVLEGGTFTCDRIGELRGNGFYDDGVNIDIAGGTMILHDKLQMSYWIGEWASQGRIVAYGGTGELVIDTSTDDVIVTASMTPVPTTYYWNSDPNSSWCTGSNWFNMSGKADPPRLIDTVFIEGNRTCIIGSGCDATTLQLNGPGWWDAYDTTLLVQSGGSLTVDEDMGMSAHPASVGTVKIDGGDVYIGQHFFCGYEGTAHLIMNSGSLTVAGTLETPADANGVASISLNGGIANAQTLNLQGTGQVMDVKAGIMIVDGDQTGIYGPGGTKDGTITAYGGDPKAKLYVRYYPGLDKTYIRALPFGGDFTRDCNVNGSDLILLAEQWAAPFDLVDMSFVAESWLLGCQ